MRYRYRKGRSRNQQGFNTLPPCPESNKLQSLRTQENQLKEIISRRSTLIHNISFIITVAVTVYWLSGLNLNLGKLFSLNSIIGLIAFVFYLMAISVFLALPFTTYGKSQKALKAIELLRQTLEAKEQSAWKLRWEAAQNLRSSEIKRLRNLRRQEFLKLDKLDPFEFEQFVAERYQEDGFKVNVTRKSGDFGIDIWIEKDNKRGAVQCKRYSRENKVGRPEIQSFAGALQSENADFGIFITTGYFSDNAIEVLQRIRSRIPIAIMAREEVFEFLNVLAAPPSYVHEAMCLECGAVVRCDTQLLTSKNDILRCQNAHVVTTIIRPEEIGLRSVGSGLPLCPSCGGTMNKRTNRRTKEPFWGCSFYPACKGTLPIMPKSGAV